MPHWAKKKLRELCEVHIGAGNYTIRFARGGLARKFQQLMMESMDEDVPIAQVVLDDDDALSSDFVATLKEQLLALGDTIAIENCPHFVTYPVGYALGLRDGNTFLWQHTYRFINLGLTMIGSSSQKNIFSIDHTQAPIRFGFVNDSSKPMFVRTLSNVNDSRVAAGPKWIEMPDWLELEDIQTRFAYLQGLAFEDYHAMILSQDAAEIKYNQADDI